MIAQGLRFPAGVAYTREVDIRYTMQLAEVSTPVPEGDLTTAAIAGVGMSFERLYERLYGQGSGFADAGMQVITYRVRASGALPIRPQLQELELRHREAKPVGHRQVFLDIRRKWQNTAVYDSRKLTPDTVINGPAVVEAPTTTVAIPEAFVATVDRFGNLSLKSRRS